MGPVIPAVKAGGAVAVAGWIAIMAQVELPNLDGLGNVGLVGILAVLVGRYTFRQLEDYRADLQAARERIDALEDELHKLGQSKAKTERRNRELEHYAHRVGLWAASAGASIDVTPPELPELPKADT